MNEAIIFMKITMVVAALALVLVIPLVLAGVGIIALKSLIGIVERSHSREARGKKKKKKEGIIFKIVRLVKYVLYALVLFLKLFGILFAFNVFVNFKLLLAVMWGVALLAAKVWILHKGHSEPVVIHEDVHHDHHYEDDHHFDHAPVEDWHRMTYLPTENYAQMIAYKGQKPGKSSSWTSWLD